MNLEGAAGAVDIDVSSGLATAQTVSQIVDDMQGVIRQIASTASSGMATWSGRASTAFDATHTDWNSSANTLNQALDDIRTKLTAGFTGYEDHDAMAAADLGSEGPLRL
ncbi:WXG100 family type VII secretion target [Gordonia desulfuricans]|uniref:ESAT-6-like protein n=1 Tax=Gordonia desulfuricans TaxID=89051 RepID=A0A7K3LSQ1_9ACTN|nr:MULTISPECIES: WXG100 family type VII secretion target [Gordonia]EMP11465.2 secretion protein [Gordonia sp. NB41Y]NDK91278.1 WXG100 family type VII secretion target [Gordonia desulfuricans]WLP89773.1 WXG100 family type VII secretion target [Gordonia sp. NB41Y]